MGLLKPSAGTVTAFGTARREEADFHLIPVTVKVLERVVVKINKRGSFD